MNLKKHVLLTAFILALWWIAGEGDKRTRARYEAVRSDEMKRPVEWGESLGELFQEGS